MEEDKKGKYGRRKKTKQKIKYDIKGEQAVKRREMNTDEERTKRATRQRRKQKER